MMVNTWAISSNTVTYYIYNIYIIYTYATQITESARDDTSPRHIHALTEAVWIVDQVNNEQYVAVTI